MIKQHDFETGMEVAFLANEAYDSWLDMSDAALARFDEFDANATRQAHAARRLGISYLPTRSKLREQTDIFVEFSQAAAQFSYFETLCRAAATKFEESETASYEPQLGHVATTLVAGAVMRRA